MYENISDSPISGLLWQWSKSNERKFGRRSNPQRNNHNLFFCLPASERRLNKYDISRRESETEGKTLFFSTICIAHRNRGKKNSYFLTVDTNAKQILCISYRSLHFVAHPPATCENRANTKIQIQHTISKH